MTDVAKSGKGEERWGYGYAAGAYEAGPHLQKGISEWAEETFGPVGSNARVAARANEEMAELLRTLTTDDGATEKAIDECADVLIILFRLADRMGYDLLSEVWRKMAVNRSRTWQRDGSGHGYHVDEGHDPEALHTGVFIDRSGRGIQ